VIGDLKVAALQKEALWKNAAPQVYDRASKWGFCARRLSTKLPRSGSLDREEGSRLKSRVESSFMRGVYWYLRFVSMPFSASLGRLVAAMECIFAGSRSFWLQPRGMNEIFNGIAPVFLLLREKVDDLAEFD
jgi:hypothetical protein